MVNAVENALSVERKALQAAGEVPEWYTTGGWQLFKNKYSYHGESVKSRFKTIADSLAADAPNVYPSWWNVDQFTVGKTWGDVFFEVLWNGWVVPPTPLYSNGGLPERGHTVSCSQTYMGNNLFDRYNLMTELAVLTKHAAGCSVDLSEWPCEGQALPRGGRSEGIMPIVRDILTTMNEVAQTNRRGSTAYSVNARHGDYYKVLEELYHNPESNNVGIIHDDQEIKDIWINKEPSAVKRFAKLAEVKKARGKGYITKIDHINRKLAEPFKRLGMTAKASNLCQEVMLPVDADHTYSCVLLNYNLHKMDEWPEHLVFIGQVMSDCNITQYLRALDNVSENDKKVLQKIKRFTEKFRALGSGVMGLASWFQKKSIVWGSLDSFYENGRIFKHLNKQSLEASKWLAEVLGEPEGCKGFGIRNATRLSLPPTKSTAELCYGVSEGINPDAALVFTKMSSGGEVFRIVPELLKLMKERNVYNDDVLQSINEHKGSVQHVDWLDEHEKKVFRTAFEIDQHAIVRLASQRQKEVDQGQSLNFYFAGNATPEYQLSVYREAMLDDEILTVYYSYSTRGGDFKQPEPCEVCT
jgi:ribonucleoside-diphosphate reductase alpha chain